MTVEMLYSEPVDLSQIVAANVRAEAARVGLQQKMIAPALGVSQGQVSKRWRGKIEWSLSELQLLAEVFGCEPGDLLKRDPRSVGRTGGDTVRLKGLEPPTFWLVSPPDPTCTVTDINLAREKRAA